MPDITVNVVTSEVTVNTPQVNCDVMAAPIEVEINCCGGGVLGVPTTGNVGDVLTKTGAAATDYAFLPPGSAASFEIYEAGENLSSGRVVIIDNLTALYFQNTDVAHIGRAYGVTKTSATAGNDVTIQVYGVIQDAAFNFVADTSLWVGADGEIFNTQPIVGTVLQKAGVAAEDKKMKIDFSITIKLE
jgi:Uncharacterized conserved protein (DUF2190)